MKGKTIVLGGGKCRNIKMKSFDEFLIYNCSTCMFTVPTLNKILNSM